MLKDKLQGAMKTKAKKAFEDAKERAEINRPDDDKVFELIEKGEDQIENEEWFDLIDTVEELKEHVEG